MPSLSQMFPSIMSVPIRPPQMQAAHLAAPPVFKKPNPNSTISAPAQVVSAAIGPSQPVFAAKPQMRDLWKETTRFVPANIQTKKNTTAKPKKPISYANPIVTTQINDYSNKNEKEKSKDEVCDEFLASLGDFL